MTTLSIIRVKRTADESPAEALFVAAKRRKKSGDSELPDENQNLVYVYAGTTSEDALIKETVDKAYKRESLYKSRGQNYGGNRLEKLLSRKSHLLAQENHKQIFSAKKRKLTDDLTIFDASEEVEKQVNDSDIGNSQNVSADISSFHGDNEVTCNGLTMVRQKLTISSPPRYTSDGDDCYDIYYRDMVSEEPPCSSSQSSNAVDPLDIMYMVPYHSEQWAAITSDEEDPMKDDSDDSNCENNWRNDYPDSPGEDTQSSSEDEFGNPRRLCGAFHDYEQDPTDFFERYSEFVQSDDSSSIGSS